MCTAISFNANSHYFGRNLDLERSYAETVVITPRCFNFKMRCNENIEKHYAIIGMAAVVGDYPLYFDGVNEKGLAMAGLNFLNNAVYHNFDNDKINLAPFEFIPYILGKCANISDAKKLLCHINLLNLNFSDDLPSSPLHWLISDGKESITVESVKEGLRVYENKVGVLTNNPPFLKQIENLDNFQKIFNQKPPQNNGGEDFSLGIESVGLPGGFSSIDRFVRAVFVKQKSPYNISGQEAVNHFFHILASVAMPKGCVLALNGDFEYTRYSCCMDCEKGDYYYTTYENSQKTKVSMREYDLETNGIYIYK